MKQYAEHLFKDINGKVLNLVNKYTDNNTINVLVSASPADYIKHLCEKLQWEYIASDLTEDGFVHVYSNQKKKMLLNKFSNSSVIFYFAISDHDSDNKLLSLFKKPYKIKNKSILRYENRTRN